MTKPEEEPVVKISQVGGIVERATALGVKMPDGVCALPSAFFAAATALELRYPAETLTVKALFKEAGVPLAFVEKEGAKIPFVENRDVTWVGPILFFAAGVFTSHPEYIKQTVEVIYNHVVDLFKGAVGLKKAKLSYVVEGPDGKTHKIDYDGPVDQLPEILKRVDELRK